jgi:hypothetical protein
MCSHAFNLSSPTEEENTVLGFDVFMLVRDIKLRVRILFKVIIRTYSYIMMCVTLHIVC